MHLMAQVVDLSHFGRIRDTCFSQAIMSWSLTYFNVFLILCANVLAHLKQSQWRRSHSVPSQLTIVLQTSNLYTKDKYVLKESSIVSTHLCVIGKLLLSQPTLRREGNAGLAGASSMKGKCAESPPTFIRGKRRKNWKAVVYKL